MINSREYRRSFQEAFSKLSAFGIGVGIKPTPNPKLTPPPKIPSPTSSVNPTKSSFGVSQSKAFKAAKPKLN